MEVFAGSILRRKKIAVFVTKRTGERSKGYETV